jgi:hypothetical protein
MSSIGHGRIPGIRGSVSDAALAGLGGSLLLRLASRRSAALSCLAAYRVPPRDHLAQGDPSRGSAPDAGRGSACCVSSTPISRRRAARQRGAYRRGSAGLQLPDQGTSEGRDPGASRDSLQLSAFDDLPRLSGVRRFRRAAPADQTSSMSGSERKPLPARCCGPRVAWSARRGSDTTTIVGQGPASGLSRAAYWESCAGHF